MPINRLRQFLFSLWSFAAIGLLLTFALQTILGKYGAANDLAWGWLLPHIVPVWSLVIAARTVDISGGETGHVVAQSFARWALIISAVYLAVIVLIILLEPFSSKSPVDFYHSANIFLGVFQGVVIALLGTALLSRE